MSYKIGEIPTPFIYWSMTDKQIKRIEEKYSIYQKVKVNMKEKKYRWINDMLNEIADEHHISFDRAKEIYTEVKKAIIDKVFDADT